MIYRIFSRKSLIATTTLWSRQEKFSEAREVWLLVLSHTVSQHYWLSARAAPLLPASLPCARGGGGQCGQPSEQIICVSPPGSGPWVSGETKNVYSGVQAFHVITITPGNETMCISPSEPSLLFSSAYKILSGGVCVLVCVIFLRGLQNIDKDGSNCTPE